jgi:hypothetical protein
MYDGGGYEELFLSSRKLTDVSEKNVASIFRVEE